MTTGTDIALSPQQAGALAVKPGQSSWTKDQVDVLRVIGAEHATEAELELFLHVCQRTGLDPFARQIYLLNYGGESSKATIQTGIDGYRLIARRAADDAGVDVEESPTEWCGPDGVWHEVWLSADPPAAARITVYRGGKAFPAVALYAELVATTQEWSGGRKTGRRIPNSRWQKAPASQLAKCAEALALRKAFPQDLGGVLLEDEAEHLGNGPTVVGEVVRATIDDALELVASATTYEELLAIFRQNGPALTLAQRGQLKAACEARKAQLAPEPSPQPTPAPEAPPAPPDEPVDGTEVASAAQLADVGRLMDELGYRAADQPRLAARMLERPVATLAELDPAEASLLIEQLTRTLATPDPQGAIDLLLAGAGPA